MDRCNFRCPYCMPEAKYHKDFHFLPPDARLSFDEIERVARVSAALGVRKLRITGGEPLLRRDLPELVARLVRIPGIDDVALTTNGVLLRPVAAQLRDAGLHRVTVSLDSLDAATFSRMSGGRGDLEKVLDGIDALQEVDFSGEIKLNTVVQRDVNDQDVLDLLAHFRGTGIVVRLIEYMDVGNRNAWERSQMVPSRELLARINAAWPVLPLSPNYRGEVAQRYRYLDGAGEIGFISSVSAPFCGDCSRARLSSDGQIFTCLFATRGTDLRQILRNDADTDKDLSLSQTLSRVWNLRDDRYSEERAALRAAAPAGDVEAAEKVEMYYIGG